MDVVRRAPLAVRYTMVARCPGWNGTNSRVRAVGVGTARPASERITSSADRPDLLAAVPETTPHTRAPDPWLMVGPPAPHLVAATLTPMNAVGPTWTDAVARPPRI